MDRDSDRQADPVGGRAETRKLIETKIDMLPDALRTVFMLCAVQGLTIEDTAAALNIAAATVRTRFMRARELMRDGLSPDMNPAYGEVFAFAGERCDRFVERVMESIDGGRNSRVK